MRVELFTYSEFVAIQDMIGRGLCLADAKAYVLDMRDAPVGWVDITETDTDSDA